MQLKTIKIIRNNYDFILLIIFSSGFFLWNLGSTYLTNWDEAWYAGISKNMLVGGNYIVPFWNGEPYFDKGPLYHWLTIITFSFTKNWELAARLPSAIASISSVILVYILGKALFNWKVGLTSGLILSSLVDFLYRGRTGNLDSLSLFFIILSFLSLILGKRSQRFLLLFGISIGLLFLVKGGLIFYPVMVFVIYLVREKNWQVIKNKYFLKGLVLGMLIPLFWITLGTLSIGKSFADFYLNPLFWLFFKYGSVGSTANQISGNYILYLLHGTKVWFLLFIPALFFAIIKSKDNRFFFLSAAFLPFFLILLGVKESGNWYLIPLYWSFAIICAAFLVYIQERFIKRKIGEYLLIASVLLTALAQNSYYRPLFIVPESVENEVKIAIAAKNSTAFDETIVVDDYGFPVFSFYGERKIKILRRNAQDTNLVISKDSFYKLLKGDQRVVLLTTKNNLKEISQDLKNINFDTIIEVEGRLLMEKRKL